MATDKSAPIPSEEEQKIIDKMLTNAAYGLDIVSLYPTIQEYTSDEQFVIGTLLRCNFSPTQNEDRSEPMFFVKVRKDHWHTDDVAMCFSWENVASFITSTDLISSVELAVQWQPVTIK